jgi:hypothetical protein
MSDETTGSQVDGGSVDQGGSGDFSDFMSQGPVQLIDDYGNPLDTGSTTAQPENQNLDQNQQQASQQQTQDTAQQQQVEPTKAPQLPPVLRDALYDQSGKIDIQKASEFFGKARSFAYPNVETMQQSQQQTTKSLTDLAAEDAQKMRAELTTYEQNLRSRLLGSIERTWNAELQRGATTNDPHMQTLYREYQEQQAQIEQHMAERRAEYEDKRLERVLGERDRALENDRIAARAEATQRALEAEAGGRDRYIALMLGSTDPVTGETIAGPGAEVVNFVYAMQNGGEASADASPEKYQSWWRGLMANEQNARMAFKLATAVNALQNMDGIIAAARQAWDAEAEQRQSGAMRPPGGGGSVLASAPPRYDSSVAGFAGL